VFHKEEKMRLTKTIIYATFCQILLAEGFVFPPTLVTFVSRRYQLKTCRNYTPHLTDSEQSQDQAKQKLKEKYGEIHSSDMKLLDTCTSTSQAQRILEKIVLQGDDDMLYKSIRIPPGASMKGISDGDLAIQTRLANKKYKITELIEMNGNRDIDRASVSVFTVTIASILSSITLNQILPGPDIIRFTLVWILTFAPLALIGYGIKDSDKLQSTLVNIQRNLFPAYRKRMIQHEAGHFLMGYLLGWPIAGYQANAVKNAVEFYPLSDQSKGQNFAQQLGFDKPSTSKRLNEIESITQVAEDVPFFSSEGRGALFQEERSVFRRENNSTNNLSYSKLPSNFEPSNAWPYRGFDESTLDQLTVISLAGVCSEILAFGNAEGGVADLAQLKQIFNSADNEMTERERENRIRFALGYTISQLRRHLGVLDDLAYVMECGGSVAECVLAIEQCSKRSGQDGILGDYEIRRRESFRAGKMNVIERVFLGNDRNIDTVEDRLLVGKGGGGKKETIRLTGDDPLYVALALSSAFLAWACNGGLSLH
jgi:hypothetical protein